MAQRLSKVLQYEQICVQQELIHFWTRQYVYDNNRKCVVYPYIVFSIDSLLSKDAF